MPADAQPATCRRLIRSKENTVYEPLAHYERDFNDLRKTLADPSSGHARADAIRAALDATAQQISATQGTTELDRDRLAKLYRGFVAASRIVAQLQEKQAASGN